MDIINNAAYILGCGISVILGFSLFFLVFLRLHKKIDAKIDRHRPNGRAYLLTKLEVEDRELVTELEESAHELEILKSAKEARERAARRMTEGA